MKERSIIMQAESVRAILEGRKTQTRRVVSGKALSRMTSETRPSELVDLCGPRPYEPGDLLWVRESIFYTGGKPETTMYRADLSGASELNWRSPIHMPKWACRLWLRVTSVRIERVQEISDADVRAEGVPDCEVDKWREWLHPNDCAGHAFGALWDSINAKRGHSWESNPWIWAVEFERTEAP